MSLLLPIVLFFILLLGFFEGSEIAIVSADRTLLGRRAKQGKTGAKIALKLLEEGPVFLTTTVIGANLCTVTNSILIARYLIERITERGTETLAIALGVIIYYPLELILGQIIPKSFFQRHADRLAPKAAIPLFLLSQILTPVTYILTIISKILVALLGFKGKLRVPPITRREVALLLKSGIKGLSPTEQRLIRKVLKFTETQAYQAMKPLIEVAAFPEHIPISEAIDKMAQLPYSNFPTYSDRIDRITGVVSKVDIILQRDLNQPLKSVAKHPYFVHESTPIDEIFDEMTATNQHFAVVVDEYGGAEGIITAEDIFEEIIGEIEDEFDRTKPLYRQIEHDRILISGRMEVEHINELFGLDLPEGDFETLAGFVIDYLGKIPRPGTSFQYKDMKFLITKTQPNRIDEVCIIKTAREERVGKGETGKDSEKS